MKHLFFTATLIFSVTATAMEGFTADQLITATQTSIAHFNQNNNSHTAHLSGFKTWISGMDAKVKLYVSHDGMNMDFNYLCQNHGGTIHCTAQ